MTRSFSSQRHKMSFFTPTFSTVYVTLKMSASGSLIIRRSLRYKNPQNSLVYVLQEKFVKLCVVNGINIASR
jgi:hypothetical protein